MGEVELNRGYYFVRRSVGTDVARFTQFHDGSALLEEKLANTVGLNITTYRHSPDAWREAFADLRQAGYTELSEAIRSGLVTKDVADSLAAGMG